MSINWSQDWKGAVRSSAWWWGIPLFVLVVTLLPYWLWNIVGAHAGWSGIYRIPVAPDAIFDSYVYFQYLGLLKTGAHMDSFGWFSWALYGLIRLFPRLSIPEIWIVSRWITTVLLLWIGAWSIRSLTGVSRHLARWSIMAFWLSFLLVIGLRPGVFSWYLPFGFFGLACLGFMNKALQEDRWFAAAGSGFLALGTLSVYPWFLLFGGASMVSLIVVRFISVNVRYFFVSLLAAILTVSAYVCLLASGIYAFHAPTIFSVYARSGISFSHMLFVSNTVLATFLWLLLLMCAWPSSRGSEHDCARGFLASSWIVVLCLWLSSPLVGVFIQNDHFVILAVMLSWMSVSPFLSSPTSVEFTQRTRRISYSIALFASLFFVYILQKALRNITQFETYTIHLSIWLTLAWAGWSYWLTTGRIRSETFVKKSKYSLLFVATLAGSLGLAVVIRREMIKIPNIRLRLPVIEWIQANVPVEQAVCVDPFNASVYGAHDARLTLPNLSNLFFVEEDDAQHRRLKTLGSAYDTVAAKDEYLFQSLINGTRLQACEQFATTARFLQKMGISHERVNQFIGCDEQRANLYTYEVMRSIRARVVDVKVFRSTCPWVIIPDSAKPFWHIPDSYREIRVTNETSIWHAN